MVNLLQGLRVGRLVDQRLIPRPRVRDLSLLIALRIAYGPEAHPLPPARDRWLRPVHLPDAVSVSLPGDPDPFAVLTNSGHAHRVELRVPRVLQGFGMRHFARFSDLVPVFPALLALDEDLTQASGLDRFGVRHPGPGWSPCQP
jgi:hypothetical protein